MFLYVSLVGHGLYLLCIIHAGVLGLIRKEVPASHNESELLSLPNDCEKGKQDGDDGSSVHETMGYYFFLGFLLK